MGGTGLENTKDYREIPAESEKRCNFVGDDRLDGDLQQVIDRWPLLPTEAQAAILAIVKDCEKTGDK